MASRLELHLSLFALLQPLDVMAQFERRPQLQSHVLHDDVTAQQHQRSAVNLLQGGREGAQSSHTLVLHVSAQLKEAQYSRVCGRGRCAGRGFGDPPPGQTE